MDAFQKPEKKNELELSEDYDHMPEIQAIRKNLNALLEQLQPVSRFVTKFCLI